MRMGFSKAFKITKDVRQFQAGESTGYNLYLGSQYYDRKDKEKKWTNYVAVVFAKGQDQVNFYNSALVIGSTVELSAIDLKVDSYNPENPNIEMIDAKLVNVFTQGQPAQQAQPQQQQGFDQQQGFGQAPQQQQNFQQPQQQGFQPVDNMPYNNNYQQ